MKQPSCKTNAIVVGIGLRSDVGVVCNLTDTRRLDAVLTKPHQIAKITFIIAEMIEMAIPQLIGSYKLVDGGIDFKDNQGSPVTVYIMLPGLYADRIYPLIPNHHPRHHTQRL
jgi:hypothetical protein